MVWQENSDARMPVIPGGTRRYNSLDKLKAICAFLVVCIHAPMPGQIGAYFTVITRIAVPIFFVISGFFYRPAKARNQIKKVALLFISGNLIYFLVRFMSAVLKKNSRAFIGELLAPKNIIAFILFNESHMYAHLWYLGAILYVLLITTILLKWNSKKD